MGQLAGWRVDRERRPANVGDDLAEDGGGGHPRAGAGAAAWRVPEPRPHLRAKEFVRHMVAWAVFAFLALALGPQRAVGSGCIRVTQLVFHYLEVLLQLFRRPQS